MKSFFIYLSFSSIFLPLHHNKIQSFWKDGEKFGFFNSKGNVYEFQNTTFKPIYAINPFLKSVDICNNLSSMNFLENGKQTSLLLQDKREIMKINWNDTTLYQTIFPNETFFRINFFGNYHSYSNNTFYGNDLEDKKKDFFFQSVNSFDSSLLTINNYNELEIYSFKKNRLQKKFSHTINHYEPIEKVRFHKNFNYIYITILFQDKKFRVITLFHNEGENSFQYLHHNNIVLKENVKDFVINFPNIYILTENSINIFLVKTFDNFSKLVFKRMFQSNHDSLFYFNNTLFLTGDKNIDFFNIIKK